MYTKSFKSLELFRETPTSLKNVWIQIQGKQGIPAHRVCSRCLLRMSEQTHGSLWFVRASYRVLLMPTHGLIKLYLSDAGQTRVFNLYLKTEFVMYLTHLQICRPLLFKYKWFLFDVFNILRETNTCIWSISFKQLKNVKNIIPWSNVTPKT